MNSDHTSPAPSTWKRRLKRTAIALLLLGILAIVGLYTVPRLITGESYEPLSRNDSAAPESNPKRAEATLTVMTANLAHGRGTGRHQMFLRKKTIRGNLDRVAAVFKREAPDVVALQEADGPSVWSGRFDHVAYLAGKAGFQHGFRGRHVDGWGLHYGSAMLSRLPLSDRRSVTFAPSPPTMSKGFVTARIPWPGRDDLKVTVVSVHLDYARAKIRERQARTMIAKLSDAERPLIVLGDFNCKWDDDESTLKLLAEKLKLSPYCPDAEGMGTFPGSGQRIDWILISGELEFASHKTLTDSVSDHRFVTAAIGLKRGE